MKKQNRGQLGGLTMAILTILVAGIFLSLGLALLDGFKTVSDDYDGSVINETGWVNSSGYQLTKTSVLGFNSPTISQIINGTGGAPLIPSANYTVTSDGWVYNSTPVVYKIANISYSYKYGQEAYRGANKSIVGAATFADYWGIIALAVLISIVIGLILMTMSNKKVK